MTEKSHAYYLANKERILKRNRRNHELHKVEYLTKHRQYNLEHREEIKLKSREKRARIRLEVLTHYSNGSLKCACCGETTYLFLTLDHIDNNGKAERKRTKTSGGWRFYYCLKRDGYPEGYQVLCWNCNSGRQLNGGVCPHKRKVN